MNLHGLAGARKEFTPNLLDKFPPHLLSTALAEHDFFLPLMPLISAEDFFEPLITLITLIINKPLIMLITAKMIRNK